MFLEQDSHSACCGPCAQKLYALLEATSEEERKSHQINTTTWSNTYSMIHTLSTQKPPHVSFLLRFESCVFALSHL